MNSPKSIAIWIMVFLASACGLVKKGPKMPGDAVIWMDASNQLFQGDRLLATQFGKGHSIRLKVVGDCVVAIENPEIGHDVPIMVTRRYSFFNLETKQRWEQIWECSSSDCRIRLGKNLPADGSMDCVMSLNPFATDTFFAKEYPKIANVLDEHGAWVVRGGWPNTRLMGPNQEEISLDVSFGPKSEVIQAAYSNNGEYICISSGFTKYERNEFRELIGAVWSRVAVYEPAKRQPIFSKEFAGNAEGIASNDANNLIVLRSNKGNAIVKEISLHDLRAHSELRIGAGITAVFR